MYREHTKEVRIGNRVIGGGNPILIQSMTNTKTEDVEATAEVIRYLEELVGKEKNNNSKFNSGFYSCSRHIVSCTYTS